MRPKSKTTQPTLTEDTAMAGDRGILMKKNKNQRSRWLTGSAAEGRKVVTASSNRTLGANLLQAGFRSAGLARDGP